MKCEDCIGLLEEYVDGELPAQQAAATSAHLMICAGCTNEFDSLTAEQELYASYDRGLEILPSMWGQIAERATAQGRTVAAVTRFRVRDWFAFPSFGWSLAGAMAVLIVALIVGLVYRVVRQAPKLAAPQQASFSQKTKDGAAPDQQQIQDKKKAAVDKPALPERLAMVNRPPVKIMPQSTPPAAALRSDVLDTVAFSAEEQDTQRHIEQAENLLRSVRNIQMPEDESEVDVSYEKALSRRLLNENVVLRRDAEMSGKFPTKTLLSDLEPFLIDIANLPDKAAPDDLRVIKERVQKTEIVADLRSY